MKQETHQRLWSVVFYGSWLAAGVFAWLRVIGTVGQEWGAVTVLLLGFAISAAVRLSRMRLTQTMLDVYRAGVETARVQKIERDEMESRIMEASAQYDARGRDDA
ncbi:MAG TPA: hypothetical protein VHC20_06075 [Candidatus Paceibacterota bacterium]|nr:hypothetical protein [Candidatus Paceibacterota bacterium]